MHLDLDRIKNRIKDSIDRIDAIDKKIVTSVVAGVLGGAALCSTAYGVLYAAHRGAFSASNNPDNSGTGPRSGEATPTASPTDIPTNIPTETTMPTPLPTLEPPPTPIATRTLPQYSGNPWTGELLLNNLIGIYGDGVMGPMMQGLVDRSIGASDSSRLDSTLRSLTNKFSPELFGADPLTEPGFGQTTQDMSDVFGITDLIANRSQFTLSGLLVLNPKGIITMEIVGSEDDRDAALAIFAAEQAFVSHRLNGFTGTDTLQAVFDDPKAVVTIGEIQKDMFGMIQEKGLGVSVKEEQERKADGGFGTIDASTGLPSALQGPDQSLSCDVYRTPAAIRQDQLQSLREVVHEVGAANTFTEADSGIEHTLWVWAYDPATGKFKVGAFTSRAYSGPVFGQDISASGEQKLPCGAGASIIFPEQGGKPTLPQKGPNPGNGSDRGTGDTGNPGTGVGEH